MPDLASRMFERYGPVMTLEEIAAAIHRSPKAIRNEIYAGRFPIATFRCGRRRLSATDKVAAYLTEGRRTAAPRKKPHGNGAREPDDDEAANTRQKNGHRGNGGRRGGRN